MPPPRVIPPIPTEPVSPNPVDSPWFPAAVVYSPAVSPVGPGGPLLGIDVQPLHAPEVEHDAPVGDAVRPAALWPPLRTASSSPVQSRAR